jgi:hypothetical protein
MYAAWICFPRAFADDDDYEPAPCIEFIEPERWKFDKVIPISFNVLHSWTDKDKELYK